MLIGNYTHRKFLKTCGVLARVVHNNLAVVWTSGGDLDLRLDLGGKPQNA